MAEASCEDPHPCGQVGDVSRSPDSIDFEALAITPPTSTAYPHGRSRRGNADVAPHRSGASTPSRGAKRRQLSGRKLFQEAQRARTPAPEWSEDEVKQLIAFMLLYTDGSAWMLHKNVAFWKAAGEFLQQCLHTLHCRSEHACRTKVVKLRKQFNSPKDANEYYLKRAHEQNSGSADGACDAASSSSGSTSLQTPQRMNAPQVLEVCMQTLATLQPKQQLDVLTKLFSNASKLPVEADFLQLVCQAMHNFKKYGRSNLVYLLSRCAGTARSDGSDSLLPLKRMPTGLLEYVLQFFNAESVTQVQCPADYRQWQQSMYTLFGTKWCKIHGGPMWSIDCVGQEGNSPGNTHKSCRPVEARTNIPALSDRTLRRDIVASGFTTGAEVQTAVLDQAAATFPTDTSWWIKGDAVDLVAGLGESVSGEWSGDADLGDGLLQEMFKQYQRRLQMIKSIGLKNRTERIHIAADLQQELALLVNDLEFLVQKQQKINADYEEKLKKEGQSDKAMFSIAWQVEELKQICAECRLLRAEVSVIIDLVSNPNTDLQHLNIPRRLTNVRERLSLSAKNASKYRRHAATHMFVFMISPERRNQKPYALPVRCVPCTSLKAAELRRLTAELAQEMAMRGMKVVGSVSNGEFNSLRAKGYTRPLSILQIRANIRKKYSRLRPQVMLAMLTPLKHPDGTIVSECPNSAVSTSLLKEIWDWRQMGASVKDVLSRLRTRTVPEGYTYCTWKAGQSEDEVDIMRSILAQLEFTNEVRRWDELGVPFCQHIYVPEIHPQTSETFHEREDEPHVLKRIATSTREGGPTDMHLERFVEALADPSTNLTYYALTGARKQSVQDAERLLSLEVAHFMENKKYNTEATHVRVIANWRRACNERGISELQRSHYNYDLLNYILDELMPWHRVTYDFSLLEVNRPVSGVRGFSRETLIALTTNIESREWRRRQLTNAGLPPEHPRASSSDDVECFFSCLRDSVGKNFTLKEAKFSFRKVCIEFGKRIDPSLPYYYYTSAHHRFHEGEFPDFNQPGESKRKTRMKRVPRQENTAVFVPGRATLPVRGSLSVRPQFHSKPLELPPLPSVPVHISEHTYAQP